MFEVVLHSQVERWAGYGIGFSAEAAPEHVIVGNEAVGTPERRVVRYYVSIPSPCRNGAT